ncbi:hypothetical protein HOLleu_12991 [Holothuria leucospilota]|uniref:Uncharacterized protein n=1 Tax=Holothuria leucospilota TaxID=206669 RepID=A0A9Q1HAI8_HOLLE|nr:hypothetical protein HOLleu_12991 [Holothuria leucospilota]
MAASQTFNQLHIATKFNSIYQQTLKAKTQQDGKMKEVRSNLQFELEANGCSPHFTSEKINELANEGSVNSRNKSHLGNQFSDRKNAVLHETMDQNLPSAKTVRDFSRHRSLAKMKDSSPSEEIYGLQNSSDEIDVIYVESSSDFEDIHSSPVKNSFERFSESSEFPHSRRRTLTEDLKEEKVLSRSSQHENGSPHSKKSRTRKKISPQKKRPSDPKVKTPADDKGNRMKRKETRRKPNQSGSKSSKSTDPKENNHKELDHLLLTELNPKDIKEIEKQPKYECDLLQKNIMPLSDALRIGDIPFLPNVKPLFGKAGILNQTNRTWQTIVNE